MSSFAKYSKVPYLLSSDKKDSSNFHRNSAIIEVGLELGQIVPIDRPQSRRLDINLVIKVGSEVVEEPTFDKGVGNGDVIDRH